MSELFKGIPKRDVTPDQNAKDPPLPPGAVARGSFWTLFDRDGRLVLSFMSGQVAGFEKEIVISSEEASALRKGGDAAAVDVINAHGGG